MLGVTLRLRCWTRDTDSDFFAGSRSCTGVEVDARALPEGVRLYRFAGGAAAVPAFGGAFPCAGVDVFLMGTETVRVFILGGLAVNMVTAVNGRTSALRVV